MPFFQNIYCNKLHTRVGVYDLEYNGNTGISIQTCLTSMAPHIKLKYRYVHTVYISVMQNNNN